MSSDDTRQTAEGSWASADARFSSNVRWALLGTAANSAGTWLLIVILARSSGAAAVGSYAIALALTAPVMSFAGLQIKTLMASDPRGRYAFSEYLRVTLVSTGLGVFVCGLAASIVGDGNTGLAVIGWVCAMRAAEAIADVYSGLWQQQERMSVIGEGRFIQAIVSIGLVSVAGALGIGAVGAAAAGALGSVALLVYVWSRTKADAVMSVLAAPLPTTWPRLGQVALQGLPLGVILLLSALQSNVPRYFIELHAGMVPLGLFAAASQLTTSGNIIVGALGSAALPRLAAASETAPTRFRALTRRLCLLGAGMGLAGVALSVVLGRQVLVLVYRPEFGEAHQQLVALSVAATFAFVASLQGYALTAARRIAVQPLLLVGTLGAMSGACALLVPRLGAMGAAWAVAFGSAVQVGGSAWALARSGVLADHA